LKIGLKGSVYAAPVILGSIVATPARAVSATPTPIPTSGTLSVTVSPPSGPAGSPFAITVRNFLSSTNGTLGVQGQLRGLYSFFEFFINTDANGNTTVVFKDLSATPDSYQVFVGNVANTNPPTFQITAPGIIGAVTVALAGGCNPTVINGSGFPIRVKFDVKITSQSGVEVGNFIPIQAQSNGAFQLFHHFGLPTGLLNLKVYAGINTISTTQFTQLACIGNTPSIFAKGNSVIAESPLIFQGDGFTPGSVFTVSAQSNNGTLLGSASVTSATMSTPTLNAGSFTGTLSTMGFPVASITLVVTPSGSNAVLGAGSANIV